MLTRFVGFNWLAVCVAAVVSESKKAVSAAAAAVVGVGLLCSPIESVQAESIHGDTPEVTELCIIAKEGDPTLSSGWWDCRVNWDVSSILSAPLGWQLATARPPRGPFYDPPDADKDGRVCYATMLFYRLNPDNYEKIKDEWVQVFFYIAPGSGSDATVLVWVEDSNGNEYDVGFRIVLR